MAKKEWLEKTDAYLDDFHKSHDDFGNNKNHKKNGGRSKLDGKKMQGLKAAGMIPLPEDETMEDKIDLIPEPEKKLGGAIVEKLQATEDEIKKPNKKQGEGVEPKESRILMERKDIISRTWKFNCEFISEERILQEDRNFSWR